jgi:hypothetical protein
MIQKEAIQNALLSDVKSSVERQSFIFSVITSDIGFLIQFFPSLILSRVIQNKGKHGISNTKRAGSPALHEKHSVWNVIAKRWLLNCRVANPSEVSFS